MKRKLKFSVDPNTLFANVDEIKKALEEASEARQRRRRRDERLRE
jgi:hypothetical protein